MDFSLLIRWDRVALLCGFCIDSAAAEGILFCHVKVRKKTRVWPPPFSVGFGKTTQKMMPAVGRRGDVERLAEWRQLLGMWSRRFTLTASQTTSSNSWPWGPSARKYVKFGNIRPDLLFNYRYIYWISGRCQLAC